ncbi:hypothetical protein DIS24_g6200 [Lasiodiplodia hormozganensis]|uniref:Uncharacterized protein n=1 Tax=Lasiodiplodia hormozganensis TaxID=869390 RepID=A0AA39YID3_9PEZI|nr:hypothetical protein DIS24_g6200 [Lasiodiplodia hormozganensis]
MSDDEERKISERNLAKLRVQNDARIKARQERNEREGREDPVLDALLRNRASIASNREALDRIQALKAGGAAAPGIDQKNRSAPSSDPRAQYSDVAGNAPGNHTSLAQKRKDTTIQDEEQAQAAKKIRSQSPPSGDAALGDRLDKNPTQAPFTPLAVVMPPGTPRAHGGLCEYGWMSKRGCEHRHLCHLLHPDEVPERLWLDFIPDFVIQRRVMNRWYAEQAERRRRNPAVA